MCMCMRRTLYASKIRKKKKGTEVLHSWLSNFQLIICVQNWGQELMGYFFTFHTQSDGYMAYQTKFAMLWTFIEMFIKSQT